MNTLTTTPSTMHLFGGPRSWSPLDWTSSDDRVRGGASRSYLDCSPFSPIATFRGTLDIKTLGGAGFASQRTTGEDRTWDLSQFDGLVLDIERSDSKSYTLTIKDQLLPKSPNGREQSTISWEFDFTADPEGEKVFITWEDLKATYRGREKKDAKRLDLKSIKRLSLMMRSFFGTQEGDFSLSVSSISAVNISDSATYHERYRDNSDGEKECIESIPKDELSLYELQTPQQNPTKPCIRITHVKTFKCSMKQVNVDEIPLYNTLLDRLYGTGRNLGRIMALNITCIPSFQGDF